MDTLLHVHRSERADGLVGPLAAVLAEPPPDAFAVEVVAVPAKGIERWLSQRLAHRLGARDGGADGICAGVRFLSPARLVEEALAAVAGDVDDPWLPDRLLWRLLEVVDACVPEPWCSTLASYLGAGAAADDHRRGRRLSTARHLARLFDGYAAHRPGMLVDWAGGRDVDGGGATLDDDVAWQAELWRRLRVRLDTSSPAERLDPACDALRAQPGLVALPERLSLFGPTRLTTTQARVLAALAAHRDVHLWLAHPSDALWRRVATALTERRPDGASTAGTPLRAADPTAELPRHPLLASLGRDARELQLVLAVAGPVGRDEQHPVADRPATVLGRLQTALQDDSDPPGGAERWLAAPTDRSLQVHACHGPVRQVEVLRDVLVGLLADDPTLEPRDVLVMCPDIEDYAPLVSAAFGLAEVPDQEKGTVHESEHEHHPGHRLRVRLADRSLRQTNPVLGTVAALLELPDARLTASQVLDLAALPPVRRRFRLTDDDLELVRTWVRDAGIRWGRDAGDRDRYGIDTWQGTWRAGLDRILLGVAMADEGHRWVGTALPLDDVESNDVDLAGRLAELLDRLAVVLDDLRGDRPLHAWLDTLGLAVQELTDVADADAWQGAQARRELAQVATDAGEEAASVRLRLADVRALLQGRLEGRPTRANFRTGNLTMCSMVPMRSVPHRVVCLLGLDDGAFPRSAAGDGDDVLLREPRTGERDPRSEDRQLLLDAVLAAQEHLVVLFTGADPRTNARRPPAVPVGEILDAVDALVRAPDGGPARDHVLVQHPLQPFDARNFVPGALGRPGAPFSFDRDALAGAVRAAQSRDEPRPFLSAPLPAPAVAAGSSAPAVAAGSSVSAVWSGGGDVALEDLVAFLERPSRAFVRQRLLVTASGDEDELPDSLGLELDGLQRWAIGDRLVRARLAGADAETWRQSEVLRGTLPPRRLGEQAARRIAEDAEPVVAAALAHRTGEASTVDVRASVGPRTVSGTVAGVFGDSVVRAEFSRLHARARLRAWAQLLALTVTEPARAWTAVTIGRGRDEAAVSRLGPVDPPDAARELASLVELRDRGLCEPLPLVAKASSEYGRARRRGDSTRSARTRAEDAWNGSRTIPGERAEWPNALVWGEDAPLDLLLGQPASDEADLRTDETTRFGALARRLWDPLLAHERLSGG